MSFTVEKLAKMQNRVEFVLGYRNLFNLIVLFVGVILINIAAWSTEGVILGYLLLVLGLKWLMEQMYRNMDDLEIKDLLDKEKKEG